MKTVARKAVSWKAVARLLVPFFGIVFTAAGQSPDFALYAQDLRAADVLLAQGDFEGVIQKLESWPERLPRPEATSPRCPKPPNWATWAPTSPSAN